MNKHIPLTNEQKEMIDELIKDWHEAGRADFERNFKSLGYDIYAEKKAVDKSRYVCLDEKTSGAFLLDKETLVIYRIKSKYGVPNFSKVIGKLGVVTGEKLFRSRWW